MPEMPEVESLARWLDARTAGLTIEKVSVLAISALKTYDPPIDSLVGRKVASWGRVGKFLLCATTAPDNSDNPDNPGGDQVHLCMHLARAGWIRWSDEIKKPAKTTLTKGPQALRVVFEDGGGFLATEAGTDKRLRVFVVRDPQEIEHIRTLGPDPLSDAFTADALKVILDSAGRSQIKGVLTDQSVIAGVGNAYSDEALHIAKLSPFKPANSLTSDELHNLHDGIRGVLFEAIERSAGKPASELKDSKRSGMRVHARNGQPCPVCGDTVREVSFATKSLQYCPTCQTGGKPLADRRLSKLLK
jgi:formamidopyrimidine-DNA glycosylase